MFEQTVENTKKVEYALNFETKSTEPVTKDINVINKTHAIEDPKPAIQLQQALDQMTKYLEALETRLQPIGDNQPACDHNPPRNHRSNNCELYPIADHDCRTCVGSMVSSDIFNMTAPS